MTRMKRETGDRTILDRFAEDFAKVVDKHTRYIIVSGFVAIAHGRSRGTEDVDMIIERLGKKEFARLHAHLQDAGFECIQSGDPDVVYDDYLKDNISVRYVRKGSFIPELELKFAKDALDEYQLRTRKKLPLTGLGLYFSSIEANIAFKEELLRSPKDMEDARHLRVIYADALDEGEITGIKEDIRRLRLP